MKKIVIILIIAMSFLAVITFTSSNVSVAKSNNANAITSEKSDFLRIVRVLENGRWYIYIYTDTGIFVSKFEEL